jgi:hypothetical protein
LCSPKGEKLVKRAYISLKYPFLAIHAKGGESISPKQKDRTTTRTTTLFQKVLKMMTSSIDILLYPKGEKVAPSAPKY